MTHERTHASFFSGAGGLDLGLERAGWRTVSFSEIDPYASAVLAQRWPGVPNLGDITALVPSDGRDAGSRGQRRRRIATSSGGRRGGLVGSGAATADLWTGGFPCQDLSVAGKRRGMGAGTRSGLAYAFLDLVEQHRPPAVLLENVPGLLSSHAGRDFGTLLATLGQLGYGWAYRVLDARYFGVPQRRRRVFILGLHARVDPSGQGAAEVLSVGTRCPRHPATGHEAGEGAAERAVPGVDIARTVVGTAGKRHDEDIDTLIANTITGDGSTIDRDDGPINYVLRPSPDADRDRAPDGLAGRSHDRDGVAFVKSSRAREVDGEERWVASDLAPTLSDFDLGSDIRTTVSIVRDTAGTVLAPSGGNRTTDLNNELVTGSVGDSDGLPLGLDSHRYRCCGNGVVSGVSEWIGERLAGYLASMEKAA